MLHTFHAKVPATTWIFLAALFFLAGYSAWFKQPVILLVALLLLVVIIERVIHTEFVIGNGKLLIRKGRFSKEKTILIADITSIEQVQGMRIGGKALFSYLVINCKEGRPIAVIPKDETGFSQQIYKQHPNRL